jgi:hypothetical protein
MELKSMSAERAPQARNRWLGLLWRGAAVWLVPFVGTGPLVGSDGQPTVPFAVFKMVAVGLLVTVLVGVRRWPAPGWRPPAAAVAYAAMSIGLDIVVLVGAFGMPLGVWGATVLPAYALVPAVQLWRRRADSKAPWHLTR